MRGINKVILVGNLGKDPELKTLTDGTPVVKMTLATTETYRDKNGQSQSRTQWHTIITWRSLATLAATYLHKGSLVYIEGKLNNRQYDDKSGDRKWLTEVFVQELLMLDKKVKTGETQEQTDENLPF